MINLLLSWLIILTNAGIFQTEQIHLSWTERENEMLATWVNYALIESSIVYRPVICPCDCSGWVKARSKIQVFNEGNLVLRYQYISTAIMENLRPDCFYEYYIENIMAKSDYFMFSGRTPVYTHQDSENPLSMIIYGDLGIGPNAEFVDYTLKQETHMREFTGIIHMGDIAYNLNSNNGITGNRFLNMIQPFAANYAYMVNPGNHENMKNFTHFKTRFKMPKNDANQGTGYFYSYNMGAAHFIAINTELYLDPTLNASVTTQNNWLKKDLEEANKNRKIWPWIIVTTHHPLYCSTAHIDCESLAQKYQHIFEDLWYENGVDLMLAGHVHNYERDTPIYKNKIVKSEYDDLHKHHNANATLYIVSGSAGNIIGHNAPIPKAKKDWAVYMTQDYGYGKLTVFNKTHMLWSQYSSVSLNAMDYVWLIKNRDSFSK